MTIAFSDVVKITAFVLLLQACNDRAVVLDSDPATAFNFGERGHFGVLAESRTVRVRVDEAMQVKLHLPSADGEHIAVSPVVLLIQGGLVDVTRYDWLATHLASRGCTVIAPVHAGSLALLSAQDAIEALRAIQLEYDDVSAAISDQPVFTVGHSLGGVVASSLWLNYPDVISGVALFASTPNPGDDVQSRTSGRVLSIAGGGDGKITSADVADAAARFAAPTSFAIVDTMTHYQWTDNVTADEIASDAQPSLDDDIVRARAMFLVDAMIAEARFELSDDDVDIFDSSAQWPDGLVASTDAP